MKLKQLRLKNFAQHEDKVVDFPSHGVIVLQGANGSGKSNIVRGLQFALRGVVPGLSSKGMAVTWGADSGSAELDFTLNGIECTVMRSLSSTKASLVVGDERLSSVSEVNSKLNELMMLSPNLLSQIVFINQGELGQVIKLPSAERSKLLHSICGTDRFEKIHTALGLSLNKLLYINKPLETSEQIQQAIRSTQDEVFANQKQVNALLKQIESYPGDDVANTHALNISYFSSVYNTTTGLEAVQKQVAFNEEKEAECLVQEEQLTKEIDLLVKECDKLEPLATQARVDCAQANQHKNVTEEHQRLTAIIASLEEDNKQWVGVKSDFVPNDDRYHGICDAAAQNRQAIARLTIDTNRFSAGRCNTCGTTKIVNDDTDVSFESLCEHNKEKIKELEDENSLYEVEILKYEEERAKHRKLEASIKEWSDFYSSNIAVLRGQLNSLSIVAPVIVDVEKANELIATYQSKKLLLTNKQDELQKRKKNRAVFTNALVTAREKLVQLVLLETRIKGYDRLKIEKELAEWNQAKHSKAVLQGQQAQLLKNIQKLNENFAKVKEAEERTEKELKVRKVLETVRDVFHRDRLPAAITRTYFASINQVWNELLSILEVPFSAYFTDNFEIILSFPNGNASIEQASGGQQCCAALTFVLAVSRLFASQIGFIVLDEPTYGLDSDRIDRVTNLLHNLQSYAMNNSLQIICVTHEERLKTGFEHVIML